MKALGTGLPEIRVATVPHAHLCLSVSVFASPNLGHLVPNSDVLIPLFAGVGIGNGVTVI